MTDHLLDSTGRPISGRVRVPGSKSITNRALVLAALARGTTRLRGALFADDTQHMVHALRALGIAVDVDEANHLMVVQGTAGTIPATQADLFVGNSGTSARFLLPVLGLGNGVYRMDGVERMRQRPMGALIAALRQLGLAIEAEDRPDALPIVVKPGGTRGQAVTVTGDETSQFLSALLLAGPAYPGSALEIQVTSPLLSAPYIELTLALIEQFGGRVVASDDRRTFTIPGGQVYVSPGDFDVEPDASAASYFFAAAAITGGTVQVPGLSARALQGDVRFVDVLHQMGCVVEAGRDFLQVSGTRVLSGVSVDMNAISDTALTLAAIAPFASSPTAIRNVRHMRLKETDRIHALVTELRRLGVTVTEEEDGLTVYPCTSFQPAVIETYDDHRMAMSFAVAGLRIPSLRIANPSCVSKTYPGFFADLEALMAPADRPAPER